MTLTKYHTYNDDQFKEHFSNYIIDHWSHSSLRTFCRNQADFQKCYIYHCRNIDRGASSIAGNLYHEALAVFFNAIKTHTELPKYGDLLLWTQKKTELIASQEIKPGKGKTIEQARQEIESAVETLLTSFYEEFDAYVDDIAEILFIETTFQTFVNIAGEDVPLPVKFVPDLIYINKQGELCIADHKTKRAYTSDDELGVRLSGQATTYRIGINTLIEEGKGEWANMIAKHPTIKDGVKHFYYFENKVSKNKDGSRQIRRAVIDVDDTAEVYELFLFSQLKCLMKATNDPDHVYLANPEDMYLKGNEILDFFIKTHTQDSEIYKKLNDKERAFLARSKSNAIQKGLERVPKSFVERLTNEKNFVTINYNEMETNLTPEQRIEHRLRCFNLRTQVAKTIDGYASRLFLLRVGAGTRISQIMRSEMDIASALGVASVRIHRNLYQESGESFVAIEANKQEADRRFLGALDEFGEDKIALGISNTGEKVYWEFSNPTTPHLLISGATGSGKSVTIRNLINAIRENGDKIHIIDPKFEFEDDVVANNNTQILPFLQDKVSEMDEIFRTKRKVKERQFIIFDECSDALSRALGEEIRHSVLILSQKARAAGIHLVLASQRFSTKVLSGDIKANFPARLAMTCAKAIDSQVMLDEPGAEKLAGKGDALFLTPSLTEPIRLQCFGI